MGRVPYQDQGQRARTSYHLRPSGTELAIAIGAVLQWGDQHLCSEYGPVATYRTRDGRPVTARFVDENGTVIDDSDVEIVRIGAETV
jgi:hypothetical protein